MTSAPIEQQQTFWNGWNAAMREGGQDEISRRQQREVLARIAALGRTDLDIIDIGCGAGWLEPSLAAFGRVTATDLANEVIERAKARAPSVNFIAGDVMALPLPEAGFDVVVTLEVLSHVADQPAFVAKLASLLRPGGLLLLATQNKPVLELSDVPPAAPGQLRRWVTEAELRTLLSPHFSIAEMFTATPRIRRGLRRLLTGFQVMRATRALTGGAYERFLERRGWGWTIFCAAEKPRPS